VRFQSPSDIIILKASVGIDMAMLGEEGLDIKQNEQRLTYIFAIVWHATIEGDMFILLHPMSYPSNLLEGVLIWASEKRKDIELSINNTILFIYNFNLANKKHIILIRLGMS
ncbi:hypothetical protein ACJX0J_019412, partial [Zea mays]